MILQDYYVDEVKEQLQEIGRDFPEKQILTAAVDAQKAVSDYYAGTAEAVMAALEELPLEEPIRFRELHPEQEDKHVDVKKKPKG